MAGSVILAGARTPIGKLSGALARVHRRRPRRLRHQGGARARPASAPDQVDYVFMGQVLQAGAGQITARQAAANGGIPMTVPATTINKVCLSGLNAIYLADQMIQAGDADVVVAGGMESMTNAPYLLPGRPRRLPHRRPEGRRLDDLRRPLLRLRPGRHGRRHREVRRPRPGIAREPQDELAAKSHERAAARRQGRPVRRRDRRRSRSRSARATRSSSTPTRASAAAPPPSRSAGLRPAFDKDGNITAGNASQISDGGAAVIVASKAAAEELGVTPLGELVGYGQVAGPDPSLLTQPSRAIKRALERAGKTVSRRRPVRAQRGVRRRRPRLDARPRHHRRHRQRQRRRHRPRPPGRHVGHPRRAHAPERARAAAAAASAPPPCAAAAARATPSSSRSDPRSRTHRRGACGQTCPTGRELSQAVDAVPTPGRPATTDDRQEQRSVAGRVGGGRGSTP